MSVGCDTVSEALTIPGSYAAIALSSAKATIVSSPISSYSRLPEGAHLAHQPSGSPVAHETSE